MLYPRAFLQQSSLPQVLDGEPPANSDPVRVFQEPGTACSYSGGGYVVVQQLLEDVTGEPFADLMQALIFDKLDMAHCTFAQPLPEAYAAGAATAHRSDGEPVPGRWHTYFTLERHEAITFVRDNDGDVEAVMIGDYERLDRRGQGF